MVHDDTPTDSDNLLDSLHNTTQLNIKNSFIDRWTVRGDYIYFIDSKKIVMYSISKRCVEQEFELTKPIIHFAFIDDKFLVSVGRDFAAVWNVSDGSMLASREYKYTSHYSTCTDADHYISCIAASHSSFLYIAGNAIRRIAVTKPHSEAAQLQQINSTAFEGSFSDTHADGRIWPSEARCGKIVVVIPNARVLKIINSTTLIDIAHFYLDLHLTEDIEWDSGPGGKDKPIFDVSLFSNYIVFCIGNPTHSYLKIRVFNQHLNLLKFFIVANPIHSILKQNSILDCDGRVRIDANKSSILTQYYCESYYQMLEISIDEEKIISSYGFHVDSYIQPDCKSLHDGVIAVDEDGHLIHGERKKATVGQKNQMLHRSTQEGKDGHLTYGERKKATVDPIDLVLRSSTEKSNSEKEEVLDLSSLEQWKISQFRKLSEDRATLCLLSIRQCSFFVAALLLLFDDELDDELRKLQSVLLGVVRSRRISGKVLCNYEKYTEEVDAVLTDLKELYPVDNVMTGEFMDFVKE